jgi:hypothetical protein
MVDMLRDIKSGSIDPMIWPAKLLRKLISRMATFFRPKQLNGEQDRERIVKK